MSCRENFCVIIWSGDSTASMVGMQYITEKLRTYFAWQFLSQYFFCDARNARTVPSAKRENAQLYCIATIVPVLFHILFH
jgi:hypothetical protein